MDDKDLQNFKRSTVPFHTAQLLCHISWLTCGWLQNSWHTRSRKESKSSKIASTIAGAKTELHLSLPRLNSQQQRSSLIFDRKIKLILTLLVLCLCRHRLEIYLGMAVMTFFVNPVCVYIYLYLSDLALAHLFLANIERRRQGKKKEWVKVSVLGYTKEAPHLGYCFGEKHWINSFIIQDKAKEKQHRYHGSKVTVPTAWTLVKAVHNNATNILSITKLKGEEWTKPDEIPAQVTEDPWKWAWKLPFPPHSSSSLSSPHLYGNGPHFTSSSCPKQGVDSLSLLVTHL